MNYLTEFNIQQLRTKNLTAAVESVAIVLGAVVANMLVPQLLLKYVYTDTTQLLEAPAIFTYFPLITYSLALGYFIYAMGSNFMRNRQANVLAKELELSGGSYCGHCMPDDEVTEEEMKELEKIVDKALKPATKKTTKKSTKKAVKKTVKKSK
jgi:hypothetical protein